MDKTKEELCLTVLNEILSANFRKSDFSLTGNSESAVCLRKDSFSWIVYNYERGLEFEPISFDNIVEACLEMIGRLSSADKRGLLKTQFLNAIVKTA